MNTILIVLVKNIHAQHHPCIQKGVKQSTQNVTFKFGGHFQLFFITSDILKNDRLLAQFFYDIYGGNGGT